MDREDLEISSYLKVNGDIEMEKCIYLLNNIKNKNSLPLKERLLKYINKIDC